MAGEILGQRGVARHGLAKSREQNHDRRMAIERCIGDRMSPESTEVLREDPLVVDEARPGRRNVRRGRARRAGYRWIPDPGGELSRTPVGGKRILSGSVWNC